MKSKNNNMKYNKMKIRKSKNYLTLKVTQMTISQDLNKYTNILKVICLDRMNNKIKLNQ